MQTKIQSTWQLINMELKQNLLEIAKTVAGVTKNVRQIYQKYSSSWKKSIKTNKVKNKIVDWILMNRSLGISVSSWELIIKACSKTILSNSKTLKTYKNSVINFWLN